MRKFIVAIAIATTALGLTACGNDSKSADAIYTQVVRDSGAVPAGVTDTDLIKAGHLFCSALDDGESVREIFIQTYIESPEADPAFVGSVAGAAVGAFCPEYTDQIG